MGTPISTHENLTHTDGQADRQNAVQNPSFPFSGFSDMESYFAFCLSAPYLTFSSNPMLIQENGNGYHYCDSDHFESLSI